MFLSKLVFSATMQGREIGVLDLSNIYQHHQFIWRLFDPDENQHMTKGDFLYRLDSIADVPVIHLLSARKPHDTINRWQVVCNKWQPDLENGGLFQFSLRINPTIKIDNKRHDIFLNAKKQASANKPRDLHELLQIAGIEFLTKRQASWGVTFRSETLSFGNNQKYSGNNAHGGERNSEHNGNIIISSVDYQGILQINDRNLFESKIKQGFGHGKRFGCGLMLLNKIS